MPITSHLEDRSRRVRGQGHRLHSKSEAGEGHKRSLLNTAPHTPSPLKKGKGERVKTVTTRKTQKGYNLNNTNGESTTRLLAADGQEEARYCFRVLLQGAATYIQNCYRFPRLDSDSLK